jgi:multiple sugar transport system permease protein
MRRTPPRIGRVVLYIVLITTSALVVFPVVWDFFTSFKPAEEITALDTALLPHRWTLEHYRKLGGAAPFPRFFLNSVILSTVSTLAVVIGSTAAGFVFAKYQFKGKEFLFFLVIATLLVPKEAYIVPQYFMMVPLKWINTYQGIIFPFIISSTMIFLMRQNIAGIPDELIDAARIDGATEALVFGRIIVPLSKSAVAAVAIINWVYTWDAFFWPLIVASSDKKFPIQVGVMYFMRRYSTDYGAVMAGTFVSLLPVLIVFAIFRRQIIQGVTMTGMK